MKNSLHSIIRLLKKEEIARRYFIMNSFDGALTVFGIIIALYLSGIESTKIVVASCAGAAISLGVSGIWSGYASERAERIKKLKTLERHLMRDLSKTKVGLKTRTMTVLVALVNGISPTLVAVIIITPFIASNLGFFSIQTAYKASILLVALILFSLGAIVGGIAQEKILPNAVKMLLAGVVVAGVSILLEYFKVI